MTLLAIDSSLGTSVALLNEFGEVLSEQTSVDTRGHIENIGGFLTQCFQNAELSANDITGVAVGVGPAPFTGLRVGLAAAKAFSVGAKVPLYPVSSHQALAFSFYRRGGDSDVAHFVDYFSGEPITVSDASSDPGLGDGQELVVITDAKRREMFVSRFARVGDIFTTEAKLFPVADIVPEKFRTPETTIVTANWLPASAVGQLALRMREKGIVFPSAKPIYLRPADVTISAANRGSV